MRTRLFTFVALLLSACTLFPPAPPTDPAAATCLQRYEDSDHALDEHIIRPSAYTRIPGFPYLRVNRFLASYRQSVPDAATQQAWLAWLAALDREARHTELKQLSTKAQAKLAQLNTCSQTLQAYDLTHLERFALIQERAVVASEYRTLHRTIGFYPLAALPVSVGIKRWHQETRESYHLPLITLPIKGKLQRFQPLNQEPSSATDFTRDALDIPTPTPSELATLFHHHAPIWEIDIAGHFDRPGVPIWSSEQQPTVNIAHPVVYRYLSHTRWQGAALLQLNYLIWFSERPRRHTLDLLGGALDGLIWRVTLNQDGSVLLYDTIHPCGCYHLFFPRSDLRLRQQALDLPEPPLVLQSIPHQKPGERIVIRIASGTHYIQRVYADVKQGTVYEWRDYQELYALPVSDDKTRSLFNDNGLVSGSERNERWLLWPMGISSPGSMRERGRHATAFVGRRHFDDPYLLEHLFESVKTTQLR